MARITSRAEQRLQDRQHQRTSPDNQAVWLRAARRATTDSARRPALDRLRQAWRDRGSGVSKTGSPARDLHRQASAAMSMMPTAGIDRDHSTRVAPGAQHHRRAADGLGVHVGDEAARSAQPNRRSRSGADGSRP